MEEKCHLIDNKVQYTVRISDKDNDMKCLMFNELDRSSRNKIKKNLSTIIGYYLEARNGEYRFRGGTESIMKIIDFL